MSDNFSRVSPLLEYWILSSYIALKTIFPQAATFEERLHLKKCCSACEILLQESYFLDVGPWGGHSISTTIWAQFHFIPKFALVLLKARRHKCPSTPSLLRSKMHFLTLPFYKVISLHSCLSAHSYSPRFKITLKTVSCYQNIWRRLDHMLWNCFGVPLRNTLKEFQLCS